MSELEMSLLCFRSVMCVDKVLALTRQLGDGYEILIGLLAR